MFTNLPQCTPIYPNVHQFTPLYSNLLQFDAIYYNLHQFTSVYSILLHCIPIYSNLHKFTLIQTNLLKFTQIYYNLLKFAEIVLYQPWVRLKTKLKNSLLFSFLFTYLNSSVSFCAGTSVARDLLIHVLILIHLGQAVYVEVPELGGSVQHQVRPVPPLQPVVTVPQLQLAVSSDYHGLHIISPKSPGQER